MNYQQIKQSFESNNAYCAIADIVDYLDTCCCENRDINGDSVQQFPTLIDLIDTYLDGITLSNASKRLIAEHCMFNQSIMSLVRSSDILLID